MNPTRVHEAVSLGGLKLSEHDFAKGIIKNVKVCGRYSKNNREYLPTALMAGKNLYENAPVYIDHMKGVDNFGPKVRGRFGRLRNVRTDDKGELYADLHYNPHHEFAEDFAWRVKNDPSSIGLSHYADCDANDVGTKKVIHRIKRVFNVDLVDSPATTNGLFEALDMDETTAGGTPDMGMAAAPDMGAAGGGDLRTKVGDMAKAILEDASLTDAQIMEKLKLLVKLNSTAGDDMPTADAEMETAPDDDAKADDAMTESVKKSRHPAVRRLFKKYSRLRAKDLASVLPKNLVTDVFVESLVNASPDMQKRLIEDRRKAAGVSTAGNIVSSTPDSTGKKPIKDVKEYAAKFWE